MIEGAAYTHETCEHYRFDTNLYKLRGIKEPQLTPCGYCAETLNVIFDAKSDSIYHRHCWTHKKPKQLTLFEL